MEFKKGKEYDEEWRKNLNSCVGQLPEKYVFDESLLRLYWTFLCFYRPSAIGDFQSVNVT